MPVIYLKHREFGTKVAFAEQEAEYDEKNGWTRYELTEPEEVKEAPSNVAEIREKRKYTRRA